MAKTIARMKIPEKGILAILKPVTIAIPAPREAALETPRVEPSARGFLRTPCITAPAKDKDAPTSSAPKALGILN